MNIKMLDTINSKQVENGLEIISNVLKASDIDSIEGILDGVGTAINILDGVGTAIDVSTNLIDLMF